VGADTTFSTFTGDDSTLLLTRVGRASFHRCSFRDFELSEGIFDVSTGSSVRLENCTFTNITVPNNDYVSTTYDDGEYAVSGVFLVENYPEDDAEPLFDVQRHRANDSSIPEEGVSILKMGRLVEIILTRCLLNIIADTLTSMKLTGRCRGGHKD
jgi:hypothetical protein